MGCCSNVLPSEEVDYIVLVIFVHASIPYKPHLYISSRARDVRCEGSFTENLLIGWFCMYPNELLSVHMSVCLSYAIFLSAITHLKSMSINLEASTHVKHFHNLHDSPLLSESLILLTTLTCVLTSLHVYI